MTDVRPRVSEQEAGEPAPARSRWGPGGGGRLAGALASLLGTVVGVWTLGRLRPRPDDDADTGILNPPTRRRVIAGGGAALAALVGLQMDGGRGTARTSRADAAIPTPTLTPSVD